MKTSWKTTTAGILGMVVVVAGAAKAWLTTGSIPDLGPVVAAVAAGVGLVMARDNDKSSGDEGAR